MLLRLFCNLSGQFCQLTVYLTHVLCPLLVLLRRVQPLRLSLSLFHSWQLRLRHRLYLRVQLFPYFLGVRCLALHKVPAHLSSFLLFQAGLLLLFLNLVQKQTRKFCLIHILKIPQVFITLFILYSLSFNVFFLMPLHVIKTELSFLSVFLQLLL